MILKPKVIRSLRQSSGPPAIAAYLAEQADRRRRQTATRAEDDRRLTEGLAATLARRGPKGSK